MKRNTNGCVPSLAVLLFYAYFIVSWIVNLVKFANCDFEAPYKEEIIHGIGIFTFFGSGVTVWL